MLAPPKVGTRDLLRLTGPILIAQLAVMGSAVIDTVMAGRLSATDLAAVALGAAIFASIFIGFMGVLQALTPIAGHHYGAGRFAEIGTDLGQALWLALFLSLFGLPILLLNRSWLPLIGAEAHVAEKTSLYLWGIAVGLPAALSSRAFIALNSAVSRPQVSMLIQLGAVACKIPLNLLFMHGAGPIPALGGAGCGVATGVLAWCALGANWAVWRLDPYFKRFRSHVHRGPLWARQRELLALGLPSGASVFIEVTSFTFIALLIAPLGAVTMGGHQIVANVASVLYMLPLALGIATSVLVAQSLGAQAPLLARAVARRGYAIALGIAGVAAGAVFALRGPIVTAYTTDTAVAATAASLFGLAALFHVFDAVQGMAGFILRGYKVAFVPMLIHGTTLWGIGLGGGYMLAYHPPSWWKQTGAFSFWAAAVVGLILTGAALTALAAAVARQHAQA